jgi:hypothetical protein
MSEEMVIAASHGIWSFPGSSSSTYVRLTLHLILRLAALVCLDREKYHGHYALLERSISFFTISYVENRVRLPRDTKEYAHTLSQNPTSATAAAIADMVLTTLMANPAITSSRPASPSESTI